MIEAFKPSNRIEAYQFTKSRLEVVPVNETIAMAALRLLDHAGLHGHTFAMDAIVAAAALNQPDHSTIITSDPSEMVKLVGKAASVVPIV